VIKDTYIVRGFRWATSFSFEGEIMSDNTSKTGLDRQLVSLNEDYEIRDWTKSFGCTEDELRAAVKAVGNSAEKVREYLSKK
jgi:hypothetical protein